MKRHNKALQHLSVLFIVFVAGCSSVVVQLVMIRELMAGFEGNEFVVALILMLWLLSGGIGALAAGIGRVGCLGPSFRSLGFIAASLATLPVFQILAVRYIRQEFFVEGASVGFLPTVACAVLMTAPYALVVGFMLPYALFLLRNREEHYTAGSIYMNDCLGATLGGLIFSFLLVRMLTPMETLLVADILLLAAVIVVLTVSNERFITVIMAVILVLAVNITGMALEKGTMKPRSGELVTYEETIYGRITMIHDHGLYTVFLDGVPALSGENLIMAEEAVHYALAQCKDIRHVLILSAEAGMVEHVAKYHPERIDYVRIDPVVSRLELESGLIDRYPYLRVIHDDARAYLKRTAQTYDAILVGSPEPGTFRANRVFTREFMALARSRLNPGGVLSFSVQGYESYVAEPSRQRISSLYNTARSVFGHVLVLPGQKVFFLAGDRAMSSDIPAVLEHKGIQTDYVRDYFPGDISPERIDSLMRILDPGAPMNSDLKPYLVRLAFDGWVMKYAAHPWTFFLVLGIFFVFLLARMTSQEFVLFTTGGINLGSEILTIFLFQILFGFLYYRVGLIITMYLAGLIPGAWLGGKMRKKGINALLAGDIGLVVLVAMLLGALVFAPHVLTEGFFYAYSFTLSVLCGLQFPLVADWAGGTDRSAARAFSMDFAGAAFGGILMGAFLVPYVGITGAGLVLIGLKAASIMVQVYHGTVHQTFVPAR